MTLKHRLLIIFLLISIIPIVIITSFTYYRYTKLIEIQINQVADSVFKNAATQLNNTIDDITHIAELFNFYSTGNYSVMENIRKYRTKNSYTTYDIFASNQNIRYLCENLLFSYNYINCIFIFTPSGPVLGYGNNVDIHNDYIPDSDDWYKKTLEKRGAFYINGISKKDFLINAKPSISFSQALYDVYSKEFLGILFIDCSPSVFDISEVNTLPQSTIITITENSGNKLFPYYDSISGNAAISDDNLYKSTAIYKDDLIVSYYLNYGKLYKEFGVTRIIILAISAICLLIIITVSFSVSNYVSKPITHLSEILATNQQRQMLETSTRYMDRPDEIGVLYNEYNNMVSTLEKYIDKEMQNKLIILDSQMKALEAQINSHFLYNTLESINSIAEIEEIESISTMSLALGSMLRYSIKTPSELVTLEEELKHVQNYNAIQQIRYPGQYQLIIDIPEVLRAMKILKLILQPLVENSLYHGLEYCRYGSYIKISGCLKNGNILLTVSDNGRGMNAEQLAEISARLQAKAEFTELGRRNEQSIGIKNIHTRIVLYYGEGYGLTIDSKECHGTAITIKVPYLGQGG